jgi:subtilase family serine protease
VQVSGASYAFDGVPYPDKLDLVAHGTFKGGIYVGESHRLDFPPCTRTFAVPEGVKVKWARLYVGVWGGTERYTGWAHTELNGYDLGKTPLLGENDDNPNVYCTGHGVYWVYYDVTDKVSPGLNTAIADTSRGERGNKLDGRVYSVILTAIYEDTSAPEVTHWVADGNVNLHGRGWAGTMPTTNDFASVKFKGAIDPSNVENANLTVLYLTGTPGEPDYLEFNGYGVGGDDVANSGDDKTYGIDLKTFDVTNYIRAENSVLFLRGKDINGDGKIEEDDEGKREGEHYLHPVLTALVVRHKTIEKALPDFSVELELDKNLTEGQNTFTAVVNNYGKLFEDDFVLKVSVDESEIYSEVVHMDASGIKKLAIPWNAAHGTHTVKVEVDAENAVRELNENDNVFILDAYVMRKPDLSVKILTPVTEKGKAKNASTSTSTATSMKVSSVILGGGAILILPLFVFILWNGKRRKISSVVLIFVVLTVALILSGCVDKQATEEQRGGMVLSYSVPVEIKNEGEAAAMNFELSLYVDGEKSVTKKIGKLEGGASVIEKLPIVVVEGEHRMRAVVDEKGVVKEFRRDNNEDEIAFDF